MHLKGLALYPNLNDSGKWVATNLAQFAGQYVLVYFSQFWSSGHTGRCVPDDFGNALIDV